MDLANRSEPAETAGQLRALLCALLFLFTGCQSTAGEKGGLFAGSAVAGRIRELWTGDSGGEKKTPLSVAEGRRFSAEGRKAADDARELFDDGNYEAAAKQYKNIAEKYKETAIGEEAQFRLAECYFALNKLPAAQDGYDQLFTDYTSTRYVKQASERLYTIAQQWLDMSDPKHRSNIRTVSAVEIAYEVPEDVAPEPTDPTLRVPLLPNFHDRTRPVFDTRGRAIKALKSIWLNDPTGPLADRALVMTARYHLRRRDYIEADRYFKILREEYPDSEYFKEAHMLGSHVKLMSYQGPAYDGAALTGADQLAAKTLNLFPDATERQQLRVDRQKMYELQAQRDWEDIQYYEKKESDPAVAIMCIRLISRFPDTEHAVRARDRLTRIDPETVLHLPEVSDAIRKLAEPYRPAPRRDVKTVSDSRPAE